MGKWFYLIFSNYYSRIFMEIHVLEIRGQDLILKKCLCLSIILLSVVITTTKITLKDLLK